MRLCIILLVVLSLVCSSLALTPEEETALHAFYEAFPGLALASPPWTSNASKACEGPGFYGITCSNDSDTHVIGLYVQTLLSVAVCRLYT